MTRFHEIMILEATNSALVKDRIGARCWKRGGQHRVTPVSVLRSLIVAQGCCLILVVPEIEI